MGQHFERGAVVRDGWRVPVMQVAGEIKARPLEVEGGSDWDIGPDGAVVPDDWGTETCPGCGVVYSASGDGDLVRCAACVLSDVARGRLA